MILSKNHQQCISKYLHHREPIRFKGSSGPMNSKQMNKSQNWKRQIHKKLPRIQDAPITNLKNNKKLYIILGKSCKEK